MNFRVSPRVATEARASQIRRGFDQLPFLGEGGGEEKAGRWTSVGMCIQCGTKCGTRAQEEQHSSQATCAPRVRFTEVGGNETQTSKRK